VSSEQPRKLEFTWEGALANLKDQYSSVELQHEAMQWRIDELSAEAQKGGMKEGKDLNDPILQARGMLKGKEGGTELFMQDKQAEIEKEEIIDSLLNKPLKISEFKPLAREDIYRRS